MSTDGLNRKAISVPLFFFLVLERYFIRGILAGALKG